MVVKYLSEQLSDYIYQLTYDHLPPKVVQQAKLVILDAIGDAFSSCDTVWAQALYQNIQNQAGTNEASILVFGDTVPDVNAAFVNAMFIQSMDFNDELSGIHTGSIIPATALSSAETVGSTGKEVIVSLVAGYDVAGRLADAIDAQSLFEQGFQPSGVLGSFMASAVSSKLKYLSPWQIANALGIAGSFAGGTLEFLKHGTDTKRFNIARSAYAGSLASNLSKSGMTGPLSIFEGENGLFATMPTKATSSKLVKDIGQCFEILKTTFKKYPCCDGIFSPLEATMSVVNDYNVKIDNIKSLNFRMKSFQIPFLVNYYGDRQRKYQPQNTTDAQLSLPFVIALALHQQGEIRISDFSEENYRNPKIIGLAQKVTAMADSELDTTPSHPMELPTILVLETYQGEKYTKRIDHHQGAAANPLSEEDLIQKFISNTEEKLEKYHIEQLIELILNLDKLANIGKLMKKANCRTHKTLSI